MTQPNSVPRRLLKDNVAYSPSALGSSPRQGRVGGAEPWSGTPTLPPAPSLPDGTRGDSWRNLPSSQGCGSLLQWASSLQRTG